MKKPAKKIRKSLCPISNIPTNPELARVRGRAFPGWEEISIEALARKSGYTPQHLRASLRGEVNCSMEVYRTVARVLGVTVMDVMAKVEAARAGAGGAGGERVAAVG